MFAVTRPSLLKNTDPIHFLQESAKNLTYICLLKSQRLASSVPFNVIEMF